MPTISMFYGIIIYMYYQDNEQHHKPHIHVKYQNDEAVISIPDGKLLEGKLPLKKMNLVNAWLTIHEEELLADWDLAINGEPVYKIEPLK